MKYVRELSLVAAFASVAAAQDVIAAKAGLIHYVEGEVTVAGKPVVVKTGDFSELPKGAEMRTVLGRAELLLGPGIFLRVAENSAFSLKSTAIENTRIELTSGSMLIEAGEFDAKYHNIIVTVGANEVEIEKRGLYRIDATPGALRVYDGAAKVITGGQQVTIKEGRQAVFGAVVTAEKFDKDSGDAFHRWAARRSSYVAMANIAAAKRVRDSGSSWSAGNWMYNPYFGCFTYIPMSGMYYSPFGWAYYSPRTVERVYYRPPAQIYNPPSASMGGFSRVNSPTYSDMGGRSSMGGGGMSSGGGMAAPAPAVSAPAASAGGGGGRGGDAGGARSSGGR